MSYVVASQMNDGAVRVFGSFRDKDKAERLAAHVNEKIEKLEDEEFAAWQGAHDGSMAPDGFGRCGVLYVHKWSVRRALRFALGEYES